LTDRITREAPGRVNLIGEHTDYNDGYVLPIATPQRTIVSLTPRGDDLVKLWSANIDKAGGEAEYRLGEERRRGSWEDYVQGVTSAIRARGLTFTGFDARIESNVPLGAGLSSSASLEVAMGRAIAGAFHLPIDDIEMARIGHDAETGLVGAPVGIMDQMAASLATTDAPLFLDTRTLAFERLHLPADAEIGVVNSGITHSHASGEYRVRRQECMEGARLLGVDALRDATIEQLEAASLPPPIDRRVRHVVTENARVLAARDALLADDATRFGALMNASHASMRDDFEVSTPEIDRLVSLAQGRSSVFGARLTGGGFGGSIVLLARRGAAGEAARDVARDFNSRGAGGASVLIP
jgi:galactokinase